MTNNAVIDFPAHTGRFEPVEGAPVDNAYYHEVSFDLNAIPKVSLTEAGEEITLPDIYTIKIKAPGRAINVYTVSKEESDPDTLIITARR